MEDIRLVIFLDSCGAFFFFKGSGLEKLNSDSFSVPRGIFIL